MGLGPVWRTNKQLKGASRRISTEQIFTPFECLKQILDKFTIYSYLHGYHQFTKGSKLLEIF